MADYKSHDSHDENEIYDVAIIGGGVIGLSSIRCLTLKGYKCILLEKEADLVSIASGSNSGIICTGVDAPIGSLERSCLRDSISEIRTYCDRYNIPMRKCGSLVCVWKQDITNLLGSECDKDNEEMIKEAAREKLHNVAQESWDAGDTDVRILSTVSEILQLEPNINTVGLLGAVHIVGEIVVDPWLLSISYAVQARHYGACILTSFAYDPNTTYFDPLTNIWNINTKSVKAKAVINATGIQADLLQSSKSVLPSPAWEAKPRRGQYRIFRPNSDSSSDLTRPIQPIPTHKTKGIFLYSSLYNHIIVGPTATEQLSRTDIQPDPLTASHLSLYAKTVLPHLNTNSENTVGEYVGIRPATNHRDYQIHSYPSQHWITASGIRSTGLSASLGIARFVTQLLCTIIPTPNTPNSITSLPDIVLPALELLIYDFHKLHNDCVSIHGYLYKVTHPITLLGWKDSKHAFTLDNR